MSGETELKKMLEGLDPELSTPTYVFCTTTNMPAALEPDVVFATIAESEGITLVLTTDHARQNDLECSVPFKKITLKIHSSLTAVGLTAAIATKLTEHGISANVIAGFYHDHVFVPAEQAALAMQALGELQAG